MYYLQRIRDTREDLDIKQGDIAAQLNIKQTQYSRYERGVNEIPLHYLVQIADILCVSLDYLTERTDRKEVYR